MCRIVSTLAGCAAFALAATAPTQSPVLGATPCLGLEPGPTHSVTRVLDGETVVLDDTRELRLIGALAPRALDADAEPGAWPMEGAATEALRALVLGKSIELRFAGERADRYGRLQAHAFLIEDAARRWVQGLQANGGTEMLPALRAALEGADETGVVRQVVFVTDGLVGNEDQLFTYLSRSLGRSRLFTVGIGSAPNGHFMTKAAQFGRGSYTYIGSLSEVGEKMGALFRKLEHPVLSDVAASWGEDEVETWPSRVPDLYLGEPVMLLARLGTTASGELTVTGRRDAEPWEAKLRVEARSDETGIHKLWARKKIAGLMDRLREGADRGEVRSAVVAVALQHHLVSAYTSLVAVDVTPTRPEGTPAGTANVPVALPAGMVHEKIFGTLPQTATPAPFYLALALASLTLALLLARRAFAGGGAR